MVTLIQSPFDASPASARASTAPPPSLPSAAASAPASAMPSAAELASLASAPLCPSFASVPASAFASVPLASAERPAASASRPALASLIAASPLPASTTGHADPLQNGLLLADAGVGQQ